MSSALLRTFVSAVIVTVFAWSALAQQGVVIPAASAPTATSKPASKPAAANPATQPAQRGGRHAKFLERAKQGNIDLLFYGDSITEGWGNNEVWKKYYAPLNAANFGISGERTQHILWGIENGEVEGINPKVVVVMIGTNNTGNNSAEQIAEGITAIVKRLREKLPQSKVLLLGIFPRGQKPGGVRDKIAQINTIISKLDDGKIVRYLDLAAKFLDAQGEITKEIMPDALHPSLKGYQIWAESMQPLLTEMMGGRAEVGLAAVAVEPERL